jgi:hypothetical protein
MAWLAHLTPSASYGAHVLPALLVLGVGMGATGAPAMFTATYNVPPADTGGASAMVSTMQQVGGAVGASGLSTILASAVSSYGHTHTPIPGQGVPASVASRGAVGGDLACTDSLTSRVRPVLGVPRKLARPER